MPKRKQPTARISPAVTIHSRSKTKPAAASSKGSTPWSSPGNLVNINMKSSSITGTAAAGMTSRGALSAYEFKSGESRTVRQEYNKLQKYFALVLRANKLATDNGPWSLATSGKCLNPPKQSHRKPYTFTTKELGNVTAMIATIRTRMDNVLRKYDLPMNRGSWTLNADVSGLIPPTARVASKAAGGVVG